MFPDAAPKRRYRICIHCYHSFDSSSAAERVCSKCRRKHNKLVEKYGGITVYESTPLMISHMKKAELHEEIAGMLSDEEVGAFLAGKNIDDSCVYKAIKAKDKKTAPVKESRAVLFLKAIIKEGVNVKERKIKPFYW